MGLGAAWNKQESLAYGITFPPLKERLLRLEKTVQIIKKMWSDEDSSTFTGNYFHIQNAYCVPKPIQKPSPPIMIGGGGEQLTLRIVAKYADACNVSGSPETIKRKMNILKEHCKSVGRDYDSILKTSLNHVVFIDGEDRDITNREPKSILDPNSTVEEVKRIQAVYKTSESLLRHEEKVKRHTQYMDHLRRFSNRYHCFKKQVSNMSL